MIEVLLGDPPQFPGSGEVELSWRILDPVVEFWAGRGRPEQYPPGHGGHRTRTR